MEGSSIESASTCPRQRGIGFSGFGVRCGLRFFPCLSIWFSVLIKTTTVDPLLNEVPRDWENWFVISRKNNLDVRYIEVWLIIALFLWCDVSLLNNL